MSKDYKVYLDDIIESTTKIRHFTTEHNLEALKNDAKTLDAVVRNLVVIGDAISKIPEDVRQIYPRVEWKKISGIKAILIHEYYGIDVDIIWDIMQNKLPALERQAKTILNK